MMMNLTYLESNTKEKFQGQSELQEYTKIKLKMKRRRKKKKKECSEFV